MSHFSATQQLHLSVPPADVPIEQYLQTPQRVVQALTQITHIRPLDGETYRIQLRPLEFLTLSIRPQLTVQVWTDDRPILHLQSQDYTIEGLDLKREDFSLNLRGELIPGSTATGTTSLYGQVQLDIALQLPASLEWVPDPLITSAGDALLNGILMTMRSRLQSQLLQDYQAWVEEISQTRASLP